MARAFQTIGANVRSVSPSGTLRASSSRPSTPSLAASAASSPVLAPPRKRHRTMRPMPSRAAPTLVRSQPTRPVRHFMSDDDAALEAMSMHQGQTYGHHRRPHGSIGTFGPLGIGNPQFLMPPFQGPPPHAPRLVAMTTGDSIDPRPFVLPQSIWRSQLPPAPHLPSTSTSASAALAAMRLAAPVPSPSNNLAAPVPLNLLRHCHVATLLMNDHHIPMDVIRMTLGMVDAEPGTIQVTLKQVIPDPTDLSGAYQEFQCPKCNLSGSSGKLYYVDIKRGLIDDMCLNDQIKHHLLSHWVNDGVPIACYSARGRLLL